MPQTKDKVSSHSSDLVIQNFSSALEYLKKSDPEIEQHISNELCAQRETLKLIASENYCSYAVQMAMGNWLTDKYAEGYAHKRFYAGCENVDAIESIAQERAQKLFNMPYAFVQPHCGADANLLAFWAILHSRFQDPFLEELQKKNLEALTEQEHERFRQLMINQTFLGMSLNSGGHLTHGYRMNISSKFMKAVHYDVDPDTLLIDYDKLRELALEHKPLFILAGYSAYTRLIDFSKMREIADEVGAVLMVDMAHFSGLVAGKALTGVHQPTGYAQIITSTTHKTLRGPRGGLVLCDESLEPWVKRACPVMMGGPLPHVMAAKAIAFKEALQPEFQDYTQQIVSNAKRLAEALKKKGYSVLTDGTDNHMVLVNVSSKNLNGRQAELALSRSNIRVNRNALPFDPNGPWFTSGIRLGTPALTTRGLREEEMDQVAHLIDEILSHASADPENKSSVMLDEEKTLEIQEKVKMLLERFPLYPEVELRSS